MAEDETHILLVEPHPDLAEFLRQVLVEEGYRVVWVPQAQEGVTAATRLRPNLIILDLPPERPGTGALLDVLRANPATRNIPLVIISDSPLLAETAIASYNVQETITRPFELEDFLAKVRKALHEPPLPETAPPSVPEAGVIGLAERILAEHAREAVFRWMRQLWNEPPWADRYDLKLSDLLDVMPKLVAAIVATLHHNGQGEYFQRNPEIQDRITRHARLRQKQGIPLDATIREYTLLRNELWRLLGRRLPKELHTDEMLTLESAINDTVDRIVVATIQEYGQIP